MLLSSDSCRHLTHLLFTPTLNDILGSRVCALLANLSRVAFDHQDIHKVWAYTRYVFALNTLNLCLVNLW